MGDYLVMTWPPGKPGQAAEALRADFEADGTWRAAYREYGIAVYVRGRTAPAVHVLPARGGVLIGDLFDRAATEAGDVADYALTSMIDAPPLDIAQALIHRAWGRYVAVLRDRDGPPFILRDPTGAVECLTWTREAVTIVASDVPTSGLAAPIGLAVDWTGLNGLVARHGLGSQICPLAGVTVVAPGHVRGGRAGEDHRLWSPGDFVRRPKPDVQPADLARVVDATVAALARDRRAILVEISGGLDSAIVATSLARCGASVTQAINHYWPQPEGDERMWARGIAERCGYPLAEGARDLLRLDGEVLMRHAHGPRPGFNAQDPALDQDLADRALDLGADALFSGQGGDGVFYQMAPPGLAADIVLGQPTPNGRANALAVLARRSRSTVWAVCAGALTPRHRLAVEPQPPAYLPPGRSRPGPHPWIADVRGVSPAKRVQVRGLANAQAAFGESLRGRAARLSYPLMSQPVTELCLSIPAPLLAIGEVDRPFARTAFADRLPAASLTRRSKGAVTKYFSQSLAASAPALREFLLDGRLVREGLILRDRLEEMLDPEAMIWRDNVGEICLAAYLEAWVQVWEGKLAGRARPDPRLAQGRA